MRRRPLAAMVMACMLLTGCVRAKADYAITDDSAITYTAEVTVDASLARVHEQPMTPEDVCAAMSAQITAPVQATPLRDGGRVGCRISATGSITDFTQGEIVHEDGHYVVQVAGMSGIRPQDVDRFSFSVRFPGRILEHRGDARIVGTTITWSNARDYLDGRIAARALDHRGRGFQIWWLAPLGLAAALMVGTVAGLVRRRH